MDIGDQINEILFELGMETFFMLMILAVLLCEDPRSGFETLSGLNFSGHSFATA